MKPTLNFDQLDTMLAQLRAIPDTSSKDFDRLSAQILELGLQRVSPSRRANLTEHSSKLQHELDQLDDPNERMTYLMANFFRQLVDVHKGFPKAVMALKSSGDD